MLLVSIIVPRLEGGRLDSACNAFETHCLDMANTFFCHIFRLHNQLKRASHVLTYLFQPCPLILLTCNFCSRLASRRQLSTSSISLSTETLFSTSFFPCATTGQHASNTSLCRHLVIGVCDSLGPSWWSYTCIHLLHIAFQNRAIWGRHLCSWEHDDAAEVRDVEVLVAILMWDNRVHFSAPTAVET